MPADIYSHAAFARKGAAEMADLLGGADRDTLKAVLSGVAAVLAPAIAATIPLLSHHNLRRRQQETENRLKRVELVDKALNVAARAKAELGIDIGAKEIQCELSRVLREIADPAILSRETLENYFSEQKTVAFPPRFTIPENLARAVAIWRIYLITVIYMYSA